MEVVGSNPTAATLNPRRTWTRWSISFGGSSLRRGDEEVEQGGGVGRLGQVVVETAAQGLEAVFLTAVAGDGDQASAGCGRVASQHPGDLVARQARQADIA